MPPRLSLSSNVVVIGRLRKRKKRKKEIVPTKKIVILFTFELKSNCEKEIYHIYHGVRYVLERFNSETKIHTCHLTKGFQFRVQEEEEEEERFSVAGLDILTALKIS